ncbi:uncharacterized protein LOC141589757 [Silene latifolia]|uniref:uncharacterized protein LOC141589757 n=1 Tax=Silene latifolia TaxID=37657 RepID=UPI003D778CE8
MATFGPSSAEDQIWLPSMRICVLFNLDMRAYASRVVSMWLSLAKRNVQELTCWIDGNFYLPDSNYDFLNCCRILESKTLTKLELHGCYLGGGGGGVDVPIDLPCLKQLCLAAFKIDQVLLDILLLKCPALETLQLSSCKGFKVLRVSGLSKLKDLRVCLIHDLHRLQIDAAMPLQCLTLTELNTNKCKVEVASNSRKNLVELNIDGCRIADDFFNNVAEFPYLKTISLIDCPKLKRINISSASLKTCRVEECPNLGHIELDTPNLFSFQYSSTGNYNIITCSSKCQIPLVSLHFKCPPAATFNQILWHSKLVALLTNFRQSKYVNLSSDSKRTLIIPQELRLSACPPLSGVRELSLKVAKALTCHSALQYLDTLLWLSSHPWTISLSSKDLQSELLVKVQYENRMKEGESCSCDSAQPIHCRGSVFKDFEIWRERGLGGVDQMRKMLEQAFNKTEVTACG